MRIKSFYLSIMALVFLSVLASGGIAGNDKAPRNEASIRSLDTVRVSSEGFKFAVWGDCRDDNGRFDDVVAKVNGIHPIFSIGLGDYVSLGTRAEYDTFLGRIAALDHPLISVPGNHDYASSGKKIWLEEFGEGNFSFDFAGARFICLDNADYELDEEELEFLEERLGTDMHKLVFAHCPPDYGRWAVHCFKKGSGALLELLEKYDVDYAFFAHIHLYDELMIGNTQGIIAGGAGAPLYSKFDFGGATTHIVEVTVTPDAISHKYIPVYE